MNESFIKKKQFYSLDPITSSTNEGQQFNVGIVQDIPLKVLSNHSMCHLLTKAFDDENKIAINSSNCPVGYNLLPVEDISTNDSLDCMRETKKEQVLLCANDQDSFIIQVKHTEIPQVAV